MLGAWSANVNGIEKERSRQPTAAGVANVVATTTTTSATTRVHVVFFGWLMG